MTVHLRKLTPFEHDQLEGQGSFILDESYEPIAGRGIESIVAYRWLGDPVRLFEKLTRVNGSVEWYEVAP